MTSAKPPGATGPGRPGIGEPVPVRLRPAVRRRVDELAAIAGVKRAEMLRTLIDVGLERAELAMSERERR